VCSSDLNRTLDGEPIHPITGAALEREAARANDLVRLMGSEAMAQANAHAEDMKIRYGFIKGPKLETA
jgi:hypothetical protein